ncbi:MAG: type II secretion system protein [Fibrobacter sp.]|nr:type II secretion system protein [Fibrobacter sp.]
MTYKERIEQQGGFTVLEVIVAIFILSCISAALMKALFSADRIHGRATVVMNSTTLAENEIERIRTKAAFFEAVQDCTYIATVGKRQYQVERRVIPQDDISIVESNPAMMEIEVSVSDNSNPENPLRFRFLQGYHQ